MFKILFTFLLSIIIVSAGAQTTCTGPGREPSQAQAVCGTLTLDEDDVSTCTGPNLFNSSCTDVVSTDNSRWYKFHCYQSGTFGFLIIPDILSDDYDWAVLDITGHTPAEIYTMNLIISLNLSAQTGTTGCTSTGTLDTHCAGGTAGSQFNRMLNLVAGHDYFLMVNNWSNSGQAYNINFSGTAVLTNNSTPAVSDVSVVNCDPSKIKVTFSDDILCSTITATGSEFTFSGGAQTITGIISNCQVGATSVASLIINLQTPLPPGPYTLTVGNGTDGNTFQNVCLIPMAGSTTPFTVPSLSPPGVTSPVTYCQNEAATALTATGTGLLWYTTASGGTGSVTAPVPGTATSGSTIYYVSQSTGGCESPRAAITVNVNPAPAAPIVTTPVTYCQNASAVPLTASGTGLLWYTASTGGTGSTTAPTPTTATAGSTNYFVSQTTGACESPRTVITVDVTAIPAAPTVTTPITYCQGAASVPLTAGGTGTLLWYNVATGGSGSTTAPTPSTASTGSITYYVSQMVNTCEGPRAAITVDVVAAPAAPTVISPVNYCQNEIAIPLTAGGAGLLWYAMATGGTGSATAPTPSTATAGSTLYYVSQTTGSCESPRAAITVNISATSTASVTTTGTACPGVENGSITATPAIAGTYSYTIDAVPTNTTGAGSGTFTNLPAGTYTITFSSAATCPGTVTGTIAQGTAPASTTNVTNPNCAGINDGVFTVLPTAPGTYSYVIDAVPANTTGASTGAFTGLAPGTYNITFTDGNGCTGTQTKTLTTNAPILTPEAHTNVKCFGGTDGTITLSPTGGAAPFTYALLPSGTFQSANTITGLGAGSHTIRVKDNAGCTKDTTIIVSAPAQLFAAAVKDNNTTCAGNDGGITITATGGATPYEYSIDNGVTYQSAGAFTNASNTTYTGVIKVRDANGCIAAANDVTVGLDNNLTLNIITAADTTVCQGSAIVFAPTTNAPAGSTYTWTSTTPAVANSTITNAATLAATVTPADTAIYHLAVNYKTCSVNDDVKVNVLWKPIINAGPNAVSVCSGDSVLLTGLISHFSGPIDSLAWTPTDSLSTSDAIQTYVHPTRTTYYRLTGYTVLADYGCDFAFSDSIKVVVPQPVIASAGRDTIAVKGQSHQLLGTGGVSYSWSSPTVLIANPFAQNPFVTVTGDASFTVIVKNATGCADTANVIVTVLDGPAYYLPNAFSPNGDGMNDIFRAIPAGMANTQYFKILNRFGETVFETNQYLKGWDGTYKGKKQPLGVYVWLIKGQDKNGKIVEMKGTVMLIQ